MNKIKITLLAGLLLTINPLFGQIDTIDYRLTLDEVIDMAITKSSAIKYVQNQNVNYFWRYRNFKTRFRPQLVLSGDLPNYSQTTSPITQPDGSIEFKQVSNLEASSRLSVNQSIPQLGHLYLGRNFSLLYPEFKKRTKQLFRQPVFHRISATSVCLQLDEMVQENRTNDL